VRVAGVAAVGVLASSFNRTRPARSERARRWAAVSLSGPTPALIFHLLMTLPEGRFARSSHRKSVIAAYDRRGHRPRSAHRSGRSARPADRGAVDDGVVVGADRQRELSQRRRHRSTPNAVDRFGCSGRRRDRDRLRCPVAC
jgi:hypothetical protein